MSDGGCRVLNAIVGSSARRSTGRPTRWTRSFILLFTWIFQNQACRMTYLTAWSRWAMEHAARITRASVNELIGCFFGPDDFSLDLGGWGAKRRVPWVVADKSRRCLVACSLRSVSTSTSSSTSVIYHGLHPRLLKAKLVKAQLRQ